MITVVSVIRVSDGRTYFQVDICFEGEWFDDGFKFNTSNEIYIWWQENLCLTIIIWRACFSKFCIWDPSNICVSASQFDFNNLSCKLVKSRKRWRNPFYYLSPPLQLALCSSALHSDCTSLSYRLVKIQASAFFKRKAFQVRGNQQIAFQGFQGRLKMRCWKRKTHNPGKIPKTRSQKSQRVLKIRFTISRSSSLLAPMCWSWWKSMSSWGNSMEGRVLIFVNHATCLAR